MTLSSQIKDKGQFQSVNSIDFSINEIINYASTTKSDNQYSVLFHEFDNTLFYHYDLKNHDIISWEDFEFQNITHTGGVDSLQNLYDKKNFSNQLHKSLDFLKTGNYSIDEQINLSQLYQKWSKLNSKQQTSFFLLNSKQINFQFFTSMSMICPIKSKIRKYKSQEPYSYSIIITAKVILDESNALKLFNIMNIDYIRIPIIVEFIVVCVAILIFILNYGYVQVQQVQRPIEILIRFLKISLLQQYQTQVQMYTKKDEKLNHLTNNYKMMLRKRNTTTNLTNNYSKFKNEDQVNTLLSPVQNESLSYTATLNNFNFFNFNNQDKKIENQKTLNVFSKINLNSKNNMEEPTLVECFDSYNLKIYMNRHNSQQNYPNSQKSSNHQLFNIEPNNQQITSPPRNNSFRNLKNSPDSIVSNKNSSQSQMKPSQKQAGNKEENKEMILNGLKPMFLEMQIIKEAFQNLEKLINYQIDASNQNSQDKINTLFHFAKAKGTFQRLQNQSGLSRCYFNLGVIFILRNDFRMATQQFEQSVWLNMTSLGIESLVQVQEKCAFNLYSKSNSEDWLQIFSKRIFSLAYSQKLTAFQMIYKEQEDYLMKHLTLNNFEHKINYLDQHQQIRLILNKSLDIFTSILNLFYCRSQSFSEIFQAFVYQEIVEILIHLDQQYYKKQIEKHTEKIGKLLININRQKLKLYQKPSSLNDYKLSDESNHIILEEEEVESLNNSNTNLTDNKKSHQEITNKIINIINSRQKFIKGFYELKKKNYFQSIEYFTQSLEEGKYYSPLLRKKTIFHLYELFEQVLFKQNFLDELIINLDNTKMVDLIFLLQIGSFQHNFNFDCCIESFIQSNFFRPKDRIQVLVFDNQLEEFLPLTLIQSQHHFNYIISSLQIYSKKLNQIQKKKICSQTQMNWQSALIQSLDNIQQFTYQEINDFQQAQRNLQKKQNENTIQDNLIQLAEDLKVKKQNMWKQNKKVIILFSNKQNNNQEIEIQKNIFQIQKPAVFHMVDSFNKHEEEQKIQSELFSYEPLVSDLQLMMRLKKIRDEELNFQQKEFLSILNHF